MNRLEKQIGKERLQRFDKQFAVIGLTTIEAIEGVVGALVWGLAITQMKRILPLPPLATNVIAYLLAWYIQKYIIHTFKRTQLFKQQTEETKFLNTTGVEILQEKYQEQNVVQQSNEIPDDRYLILPEIK